MYIAICDDNEEYLDKIEYLLEEYCEENSLIISKFSSGEDFLENVSGIIYDIIFLDIEMKEISGIDVASFVRKKKSDTIIFFITSYTSYISDTFRLGAFQFLRKPINESEFKKEFERAVDEYKAKHQSYIIKWKGTTVVLEYSEICYIEVYKKHLHIHTEDDIYECLGNLSDESERLKLYKFSRCHQGYIVNLSRIKKIDKQSITMKNGDTIPIGRRYKDQVNIDFTIFVAERMI